MSPARTLVDLSRRFYRAKRYNSNNILRPLSVAAKTILTADQRFSIGREGLTEAVRGELRAFMKRVQTGSADGMFPPGSSRESREETMQRFAEYFVGTIFYDTFRGDMAALRGRQLNIIKNTCEVLYRDAAARSRQEAEKTAPEEEAVDEED